MLSVSKLYVILILACQVLLFSVSDLRAQKNVTQVTEGLEALTVEDGLCYRHITSIVQDEEGLMWFGTPNGLSRYDGYKFLNFGNTPASDQFFEANNIQQNGLCNYSDSTLWIIADNQLFEFNTETFHAEKKEEIDESVLSLKVGKQKEVWLISQNDRTQSLWKHTPENGFVKIDSVKKPGFEATDIELDTSGQLWWSTMSTGLRKYDTDGVFLKNIKIDSFYWQGETMLFTDLLIDRNNQFYIYSRHNSLLYQIWKYDIETGEREIIADGQKGLLLSFEYDSRGNIWIAQEKGLLRVNKDGGTDDFSQEILQKIDFSIIDAIYEDHSNILWVGTDGGILKLPIQKKLFNSHLSSPSKSWGNAMRGIVEDKNEQIYFFCNKGDVGLYKLNQQTEGIEKLDFGIDKESIYDSIGLAKFFVYDEKRNSLWTMSQKLLRLDLDENLIEAFPLITFPREISNFNPIIKLPDSRLLIGNILKDLALFNPENNSFHKIFEGKHLTHGNALVKFFEVKNETEYWVGTEDKGVFLVNYSGEIINEYNSKNSPPLSNDRIMSMVWNEEKNSLRVGSFGSGVDCINVSDGSIQNYNERNGLPNNNVASILGDGNNMWIATFNGLSYFNDDEKSFQNFYSDDGLSNNEFNYSSAFKSKSGRMYFGGMNGVNSFMPKEALEKRIAPPLKLTKMILYNQNIGEVEEKQNIFSLGKIIRIAPSVSYFQFEFSLPNYLNPEKNQYYTWMEGLEDDWSYLGNTPSIRFNKIPPGEYTLHLKGKDSKGNWNSKALALNIKVQTPWYKTWWFYALSVLSFLGVVYMVFQNRIEHLLELEKLRTKISSDLHDDLGSMLSGLAMQSEIMELRASEVDKPRLQKISRTSREAVHRMRDLVWSIDTRKDRVSDLIVKIRETAEDLLLPAEIEYKFEIEGFPKREKRLSINFRQNIFLIYKEAINNILKHADASMVTISILNDANFILFCIKDNGQNDQILNKKFQSGQGLLNIRMRVNQLKGEVEFIQENGFLIKMKIPNNHMYM